MMRNTSIFLAVFLVALGAFVWGEHEVLRSFQTCVSQNTSAPIRANALCTAQLIDTHAGFFTALASFVIAAFTGTLWVANLGMLKASANQANAMERSIGEAAKSATAIASVAESMAQNVEHVRQGIATNRDIAAMQRRATLMQFRPYVSPINVEYFYSPVKDSRLFNYQIRVVWNNHGSTPTRRLSLCTTAEIRETVLPETFDFPYDEARITKGILLPHIPLRSAYIPWGKQLMVEDIEAIQTGGRFLYVWGWAKYKDAFENTPQHVTKFSWIVEILGNPRTFVPHSKNHAEQLEFRYSMLGFGNCTDEECDE
jgi:hypothetical protein